MASLIKKYLLYASVAAIVGLSVYVSVLRSRIAAEDRRIAVRVDEQADALGAVHVQLDSANAIDEHLGRENAEFLHRLQSVDHRVQPAAHVGVEASVADRILLGAGEHRFQETVDGGGGRVIVRRQLFGLDVLVVRNVNGKFDLGRVALTELDPDTKVVLDTKFGVESHIEVSDEFVNPPAVPVFHPRVVAGVELHGFPLLGVEVLNGERFGGPVLGHLNVSLFGVYNPRDKSVLGGASVGYRPFNSNISVGPAVFHNGHALSFGAMASIELTR